MLVVVLLVVNCCRPVPRSHVHRREVMMGERGACVNVAALRDPLSTLSAAQFLANEVGDELPLKTGPARVALFMASLLSPGSLPNPFATTRWEPRTFAARDNEGRIVGVAQTALANVAGTDMEQVRTVRFFQNIVVSRSWRRRGVATSMLNVAIPADIRFDSALAVDPENEAAVALYRRCGFEMAADEPGREGLRLMLRSSSSNPPPRTGSRAGEPRMMAEEPRKRTLRRRQKESATDATKAAMARWAAAKEAHKGEEERGGKKDRLALQAMLSSELSPVAQEDDEVETVGGGGQQDSLTAAFAASVQSPRWRLRKRPRKRLDTSRAVREAVARWEHAQQTGRVVPLGEERRDSDEESAQAEYRSAIESANQAMELSRWRAAREAVAGAGAPASEAHTQLAELVAAAEAAEAAALEAATQLERANAASYEARAAALEAFGTFETAEGGGEKEESGADEWREEEARLALEALVSPSFHVDASS